MPFGDASNHMGPWGGGLYGGMLPPPTVEQHEVRLVQGWRGNGRRLRSKTARTAVSL